VLEHSVISLPDDAGDIAKLEAMHAVLPDHFRLRAGQPVYQLLDTLAYAIERLTAVPTDERTTADRMADVSTQLFAAANELRSVNTLKNPAREESVELAREILRRLNNLGHSDQTMKEMIDVAKPDDQERFARGVGELVGSYHMLLREVAKTNPDIMNDPRIKAANETVGGFAQGVGEMTVKNLPESSSKGLTIAAELAAAPVEWKGMRTATVGMLTATMDQGVEKVAASAQAQRTAQQAQQQSQQQSQQQAQSQTLRNNLRERRATQRTEQQRSSGQSSGAQQQQQQQQQKQATQASIDRAVRQAQSSQVRQQRNQQTRQQDQSSDRKQRTSSAIQGLSADAMAAIKQLGGSLQKLSKEASKLPPPEAATEKGQSAPVINPLTGEQSFAQHVKSGRNNAKDLKKT
jgi:hypothetical protein